MGGSVDEHGHFYDKIRISMNGICCYFVFQRHPLNSADGTPSRFIRTSHFLFPSSHAHCSLSLPRQTGRKDNTIPNSFGKAKMWSPMSMRSTIIIRPSLPAKLTTLESCSILLYTLYSLGPYHIEILVFMYISDNWRHPAFAIFHFHLQMIFLIDP
jgi:hypothetical protein